MPAALEVKRRNIRERGSNRNPPRYYVMVTDMFRGLQLDPMPPKVTHTQVKAGLEPLLSKVQNKACKIEFRKPGALDHSVPPETLVLEEQGNRLLAELDKLVSDGLRCLWACPAK